MQVYRKANQGMINSTVQASFEEYQSLSQAITRSRQKAATTSTAIRKSVQSLIGFILSDLGMYSFYHSSMKWDAI